MNILRSRLLALFPWLCLAALALWTVRQHREIQTLKAETSQTALALDTAKKHAHDAEARLSDQARAAPENPVPKPAPAAARPAGQGFSMAMFDNPAMQKMMATATKNSLDQRYGSLFRKLKLAPADLERLKSLLTERQMTALDTLRAAQTQGVPASEINALLNTASADTDTAIRSLLSDPAFAQLQDYDQNLGSHGVLDQVESRLGFTSAPLTDAQSDAVLRIIEDTSASSLPPGAANDPMFKVMQGMGGGPPMMSALSQPQITDKTIEAAQAVLNDSQVEVLRQVQADQQAQLSAMQSMRGGFPMPGGGK